MMISVTQPRRPADDFLASLQANLQGTSRTARRKGQQRHSVADEASKKTVVAKEQKRLHSTRQQNSVKPDNIVKGSTNAGSRRTESNKHVKQSTKPSASHKTHKKTTPASSENELVVSKDNVHPESHVKVVPEIIPHVLEQAPIVPQLSHQPPVEVVQPYQVNPTYQHVPTHNTYQNQPPHQQAPRQSQNNFYLKNQSNIFNTGWNSYANTASSPRVNNPIADNVVVENALRIASQQPLPPPPTLSARVHQHHENTKPVEDTVLSNHNHMMTSQQQSHMMTSQQHNHMMTSQQHVPSLAPATGSDDKPLHSHYRQSFSITGGLEQDTRTVQELERRKWIQELEAQIKEKKERDQQEKLIRRSPYPAAPPLQYAGAPAYSSVTPGPSYPTYQTHIAPPPNTLPQTNIHEASQGTHNTNLSNVEPPQNLQLSPQNMQLSPQNMQNMQLSPQNMQNMQLSPQNMQLSPQNMQLSPQTLAQQQPAQSPTLSHKLGQHAWVDPVEQERRQEARRRALENQEIIRKQVEERDRLKREEQERIKREEELEMRKIEEEKRRMAEEVRIEEDKARKKEQAQLEQISEMKLKIEEANKSALELKRGKRSRPAAHSEPKPNSPKVVKTQSCGEDVTAIKQSSEVLTSKPHRTPQKDSRPAVVEVEGVEEDVTSTLAQQTVRYVSNAATQTVAEASCQTIDRENSTLPSETKLIQLHERELSAVQRQPTVPKNRTTQSKQRSVNKPPIKKENTRKVPEKKENTRKVPEKKVPKFQYDNNGRRIQPKVQPVPLKAVAPLHTPANIIAEESVAVEEYASIADIFDNPKSISPIMEVESVVPSPFSISDQQIQMRYTSPHNEERTIPSAISARQNDILNQLEKLRMGLKDRRVHMRSVDNDQ